MPKIITPRVNAILPQMTKMPLGTFIQNLNVPGMTPAEARGIALGIQSGNHPAPKGTK
jgi:hypothetical protein